MKLIKIIIKTALYSTLAGSLFILILVVGPKLLGYQSYIVYSGSMEPSVPMGALVVAKPVDPATIEVGDIIVFHSPDQGVILTHRVIAAQEVDGQPLFHTKGDANDFIDPTTLKFDDKVGKVVYDIPWMGYFLAYIGGPMGRFLPIVVPGIALFILARRNSQHSSDQPKGAKDAG